MAIADLTKLSLLTVMGVDLDYCSSSYWIVLSLSTDITGRYANWYHDVLLLIPRMQGCNSQPSMYRNQLGSFFDSFPRRSRRWHHHGQGIKDGRCRLQDSFAVAFDQYKAYQFGSIGE